MTSRPPQAWGLIALLTLMAPRASAQDRTPTTPNPGGPSAIEQALIEHACRSRLPGIAGDDAYQECLGSRLRLLRDEFGRDLSLVSATDRNALDTACSKTRQAEGREAYLECLTVQLVAIRNRRSEATTGASQGPLLFPPEPGESLQSASPVVPESQTSSSRVAVWIGVALVALVVAGGGAFMAVKGRRQTRKCRVCGADVPEGGDLCSKCRHEAADVLRHAAAERADHLRAHAEAQQRLTEREEELRQQRAREEAAALLRQELEARRREEARRQLEEEEEAARRRSRAEEAAQRQNKGEVAEEVFDPYYVLGVPRDAGKEAVDAACEQLRLKYAPGHVAHLGPELQEHYKRKAEAVERAYRILSK